tara:strand:+ start:146 stop:337 length:192 start_codon:yes stop_codon:yes gene_type:complete
LILLAFIDRFIGKQTERPGNGSLPKNSAMIGTFRPRNHPHQDRLASPVLFKERNIPKADHGGF